MQFETPGIKLKKKSPSQRVCVMKLLVQMLQSVICVVFHTNITEIVDFCFLKLPLSHKVGLPTY